MMQHAKIQGYKKYHWIKSIVKVYDFKEYEANHPNELNSHCRGFEPHYIVIDIKNKNKGWYLSKDLISEWPDQIKLLNLTTIEKLFYNLSSKEEHL